MIYINLLIIFLILIFIHELGHYFAARIFNAKVTDFSIGFGRPIFKYNDKNDTCWKVAYIPLGGYVKIKGLDSIFQNNDHLKKHDHDSFQNLDFYKKIIILLAGSIFNIVSSWMCLFFILFFFGISSFSPEIGKVFDKTPAQINDLRVGDTILKINDKKITEFSDIPGAINNKTSISLQILRNNEIIFKNLELKYDIDNNRYIIGIASIEKPIIKKYLFFQSFYNSIIFIPNYYISTFKYLTNSFENNTITNELSGPIGIVKMADQLMLDQIKGVLFLFIMISLFVALFNLLPIPLMDGGHIVYFTLRHIFSNALPHIVTRIYLLIGISILSFLFIFVTLNDIFYK